MVRSWREPAAGLDVAPLVWVLRVDLFPQGFKVWIAQPLIPLFSV
jgi:hypothetical protein